MRRGILEEIWVLGEKLHLEEMGLRQFGGLGRQCNQKLHEQMPGCGKGKMVVGQDEARVPKASPVPSGSSPGDLPCGELTRYPCKVVKQSDLPCVGLASG